MVHSVVADPRFFRSGEAKRAGHKKKKKKKKNEKRGSITYSTERESEASKIFIILWVQRDGLKKLLYLAARSVENGPLN